MSVEEEQVDYGESSAGSDHDGQRSPLPAHTVDFLAEMPKGTKGLPLPLLLKQPGQKPEAVSTNPRYFAILEAAIAPERVKKRATKTWGKPPSLEVEEHLQVGQFLSTLPEADQDLWIRLRDLIHANPPEDDYHCCHRWIYSAYLALFYPGTFNASDPVEALRHMVRANERYRESWGEDLLSVRVVPLLGTDLAFEYTGQEDTWLNPILQAAQLLYNPDRIEVTTERRTSAQLHNQTEPGSDKRERSALTPLTVQATERQARTLARQRANAPLRIGDPANSPPSSSGTAVQRSPAGTPRVATTAASGQSTLPPVRTGTSSGIATTSPAVPVSVSVPVPATTQTATPETRPTGLAADWVAELEEQALAAHYRAHPHLFPPPGQPDWQPSSAPPCLNANVANRYRQPGMTYAQAASVGAYWNGDSTGALPQVYVDAMANGRSSGRGGGRESGRLNPVLRPPSFPTPVTDTEAHAGPTEAPTEVERLFANLTLGHGLQEVVSWYHQGKPHTAVPSLLKNLSFVDVALLEEKLKAILELRTHPQVTGNHAAAPTPTRATASTPHRKTVSWADIVDDEDDLNSVPGSPVAPVSPVRQPESPPPVPVQPPEAVQPVPAAVAANPAPAPPVAPEWEQADRGGRMNGLKLPEAPTFTGRPDKSNPKDVRHFLRNMELLIRQTKIADPVLYACSHLTQSAADWRDIEFLPVYALDATIPWQTFVTALQTRFVTVESCHRFLERFKDSTGQNSQSVQEYNSTFKMRVQEIMQLPHITLPDSTSLIQIYTKGLKDAVWNTVQTQFIQDPAALTDLDALMALALQAEVAVQRAAAVRKSTDTSALKTQAKRGRESATPGSSTPSQRSEQSVGKGRKQKKNKPGSSASTPVSTRVAPEFAWDSFPQHLDKELKSPVLSTERLKELAQNAACNVPGPKGVLYPNIEMRLMMKRDCEVNKKCFGCGDQPAKHPYRQCPNPKVRSIPAKHKLNLHITEQHPEAHHEPADTLMPDAASPEPVAEHRSVLNASMQATPFRGLTMLFAGAVSQQPRQKVNVLLDTGSTHNYCRPKLTEVSSGAKAFTVTVADNNVLQSVPEKLLSFSVQGISCAVAACEMPLPPGVDIILGQSWLSEHNATLLMAQGLCTFVDDNKLPAAWNNTELKHDAFNSSCMWTSASRVNNSAQQVYIAYVRMPEQSAAAAMTIGHANLDAAASQSTESVTDTDRLDKLFVEQGSVVPEIRSLVKQFATVFPEDVPAGLPIDRGIAHAIPLQPGHSIPAAKTYRLSKPQREEMEAQIKNLLSKGWIRPSTSPFGSPILFAKKKNGGMRMCVDYRAVNKMTVRNSYPLPRIDDLLDSLTGAKIFTCLDLQQAYHQIRLQPEDVPKTAFTTPAGLYEYMVLPFGLTNAPSTFQALVNSILGTEMSHCCLVYLDDIVVFSKTPEEHLQHLRLVLSKLQGAQLYARLSKCRFALSAIKFLGHVVDQHGIHPDPDKVKIVQDWDTPQNVSALRSFLGLAQYFRKFIQGFSILVAPLTALFKKNTAFAWTPACDAAFQAVKAALISAPCLKLPDAHEPFTVITDACIVGIGGVLMQGDRPVAFDGRALTEAEKKWSTTEQEMLGVVYHLDKWRCYLEGVRFTVVTDHQPNVWFASQKVLSPRLARWYERLAQYDFTWEYRSGRLNVADPLSRHPSFCNLLLASSEVQRCLYALMTTRSQGVPDPVPTMLKSTGKRNWDMHGMLKQAHAFAKKRKSEQLPEAHPVPPAEAAVKLNAHGAPIADSSLPPDHSEMLPGPPPRIFGEKHSGPCPLQKESDQHCTQSSRKGEEQTEPVPVPEPEAEPSSVADLMPDLNPESAAPEPDSEPEAPGTLHAEVIPVSGDAHVQTLTEPQQILQLIRDGYAADPLYPPAAAERRSTLGITAIPGGLFMRGSALCVPDASDLHRRILRELHCSPYSGHVGMNKTYQLIKRHFYWPNLQESVNSYVRGCVTCQRSKAPVGKVAGKLMPLPVPDGIWEDISMDFVGPLPLTARHHDYVLVVVDRLSKMAHFLACKSNITARQTAQLFVDRVWSLHGLPKSVVTDRGRQFLNSFNAALLKLVGTKHNCSSAYHPESDGQTERVNRILGEMLRHFTNLKYTDWDDYLPLVEFAHNNAPTTATGMSPFFCCYGKHPLTPMSAVIAAANAEWEQNPHLNKDFLHADNFLRDRQEIVRKAQAAMQAARQRMELQEADKRKAVTFQVGDQVSLKTQHLGISTLPSKKLFQPWMGPFTVSKVINDVAYQLELPHHWKAHNVFHVSLLKPFISNGEAVDPQSFTLVGGKDDEYEVESIVDYTPKTPHQNGSPRKVSELVYHVKWRGIPWGVHARQPFKHLKNCPDALTELAKKFGLPEAQFAKGSNRMPT